MKAFNIVQEDVPALYMWRINQYYGISNKVDFTPTSTDRIYGTDITMK